jgi:hypothetical protein
MDVEGITGMLPDMPTAPMPGLIVTAVALDTLQLSVDDPPPVTMGGLAMKLVILGRPEPVGTGVDPVISIDVVAVVLVVPLLAVSV